MEIITQSGNWESATQPLCMAIGMFDGLHLGHQAVIGRTVSRARNEGALALVATFDQHPAKVIGPHHAPPAIQTLSQRLRCFAGLGINATWLIHFDRTFSEKSAEEFVRDAVRKFPGLRVVLVGEKFRFGHRRQGTVEFLRNLGRELGFEVEAVPSVNLNGEPVSSTRIRREIRAGHLDEVGALLGRPYALAGKVVEGDRLGRQLGFPTANLAVEGMAVPPNGVYAAHAEAGGWSGPAVVNIGFRPTVERHPQLIRVEAHLIGFDGEIYGEEIELFFLRFLRSERKFDDIGGLRAQISEDCRVARDLHETIWRTSGVRVGESRTVTSPRVHSS